MDGKEKDYSISYSTYMNLALYAEEHGYYMKEREKNWKTRDFLQVATYPLFCKTFAKFLFVLLKMVKLLRIFVRLVEEQEGLLMMFYKNGSNYHRKPLLI